MNPRPALRHAPKARPTDAELGDWAAPIVAFLGGSGAAEIDHPGGTLLAHLRRTSRLLLDWGCRPELAAAGLCHAAYGTDGFPVALLPTSRRDTLTGLIGQEAEAIVYLYASCDRAFLYPRLGREERPSFRDRFTGELSVPDRDRLADFGELTFANELDIAAHSPTFAKEAGPQLTLLFRRCQGLVTPVAYHAFIKLLGSQRKHPLP